ncbi:MAG: tRNA (adenosine(37)-N6)-threonylcarbamoyltransferase complex dimerization subunit type 1 TsaB [Elusimicrobia bacterium RIFCSPLOWO2_01_FULL_60_11]|nr:MAG: tRNA (adenosine(37)-N6)-threonylcarbamoyltransferase complex dimerization subunit type 1 TsaB [Elusimicrobia bacterium RIFCSPLOWO2_01_FULL_60_11]
MILAIETSGASLSVALRKGGNLLGQKQVNAGRRHSEMLAQACESLLKSRGVKRTALTHLAVCTGPGSFTGLRVGITFARTLAQFLKIPLIGIPVFEVLAAQAGVQAGKGIDRICIAIPSIGEDVYAGFFRPGSTAPLAPYRVLSRPELLRQLERAPKGKLSLIEGGSMAPRASTLAGLATERIDRRAISNDSWKKIHPLYLRLSIAQERKERRGKT